jgi:hypothetical protein
MKRLIIALAAIVALASQALAEDTSAAEATQCDSFRHRRHCHVHSVLLVNCPRHAKPGCLHSMP